MRTVPAELPQPPDQPELGPLPAPVQLEDVDWVVITPGNLPEGDDWVIIGLDPDDHETLSRNQAELLRWIIEARRRYELARQGGATE